MINLILISIFILMYLLYLSALAIYFIKTINDIFKSVLFLTKENHLK